MDPLHPRVLQVHRVLLLSVSTCLYGYGCLTFPLSGCLCLRTVSPLSALRQKHYLSLGELRGLICKFFFFFSQPG